MEWKWTKGEPYERSRRIFKEQPEKDNEKFNKEIEQSAYATSLHHDENTWDILNQTLSGNGFKVSNKREEIDTKMADRDMIQQIGNNPFLSETNYLLCNFCQILVRCSEERTGERSLSKRAASAFLCIKLFVRYCCKSWAKSLGS
jgi:hypothetical protein